LSAHGFSLPRQESAFSVGEPDASSAQAILEQPVLSLQEFDNDQLMAMNPASGDHQQKGQQQRHRAHAVILPPPLRSQFWTPRGCYHLRATRPKKTGQMTFRVT